MHAVLVVHLDKQIERARARSSDLAHGLKTPLQVLLSNVEVLKRKGEPKPPRR
jgi:hypothetical protein